MLSYTDLKSGVYIVADKQPYLVVESEFVRMQQRKPVMKTKIKNLISGKTIERSFQPSDNIEEAELEKMKAQFIYESKGEYWFHEVDNPKDRFSLKSEEIGELDKFLKPNLEITALKFRDNIINIELPIKVDYKVVEAPPAIRGDTAQGGTKTATIETGAKITVPLFIQEEDIIRINTQTGEYAERVEKG
ncbi:MAG: elongation factor P [Candidatus Paceibacterota bacterium]